MDVSYSRPLESAARRMRRLLFRPFEPVTWFVVGFVAFLAFLPDYGFRLHTDIELEELRGLGRWLLVPWVAIFGIGGLLLYVGALWVGSRARLILLDNVVRNREGLSEPWKRLATLGNSLFLWRLGFSVVQLLGLLLIAGPTFLASGVGFAAGWSVVGIVGLGVGTALTLAFVVASLYVTGFLDHFVVPIMYRDGLRASDAWRKFLPLLRRNTIEFLIFGLVVAGLVLAAYIAVTIIGFLTCCLGILLLAIPYVGTLVTLPLFVAYRGIGPEFLAQFGPEYDVFGHDGAAPPPSDPGGAPPVTPTPPDPAPTSPVPSSESPSSPGPAAAAVGHPLHGAAAPTPPASGEATGAEDDAPEPAPDDSATSEDTPPDEPRRSE